MQCANCRFENMPGVDACGRCGASLQMATATLNVHPPRAGKWVKRLRKWDLWRHSFRLWHALTGNVPRLGGTYYANVSERPLLLRLAVPGWAQIYCERTLLGWFLLGLYALLLAFATLFIGTQFGSVLLGLALACHAASIVDIVNAVDDGLVRRVSLFVGFLFGVAMIVYLPAGWLATRFAVPRVIAVDSPPFRAGDVVLYAPATAGFMSPHAGQVVLYRLPNLFTAARNHTRYFLAGERIDRILAGPGQRVVWRKGKLEVDGEPSALAPLDLAHCPADVDVTAAAGEF